MILVGIEDADTQEDIDWLCKKIVNLRIFDDENGVMNKSILEVQRRNPCHQPVHADGVDQEGQPPLLHSGSQTGNFRSAVRTVLQ